jgi:hypothetical protein
MRTPPAISQTLVALITRKTATSKVGGKGSFMSYRTVEAR